MTYVIQAEKQALKLCSTAVLSQLNLQTMMILELKFTD